MTDPQGLPVRRRILAVIALSLGSLLLMIDATISGVILPTIATALGVKGSATLLVVTVYQLILAMTLLPLAALGDRIGYRRMYQAGFVLHSIAGVMCLFVDSLPFLIAVRAIQSLAAAAAMSVGVAMLRQVYPPQRLGSGLALNTIFNASGTAVAPILGGFIAAYADWQWAFVAVVPLTIISLIFSRALPDPVPHEHPFDLRGAALCSLTFGLLIAGLEATVHTDYLFTSLFVMTMAGVSAWFLVRHEKHEAQPVLPVDLLARADLGLTALGTLMGTIGSMIIMLSMPFRLQEGYGFSVGEIGGMMSAYALASLVFAPVAGALSDRIAVPILCTIGTLVASVAMVTIATMPEEVTHVDVGWRLFLCGAGFGFFFSPNARFLVGSAPKSRAAAAGSLFTTTRMLAMAFSATLVAALLAMDLGTSSVPAYVGFVLVLLTAVVSATGLRRKRTA
ncbi:MFS transporter [Pseudomaricurvus sp.]|uniref:MFS transporter n=1 Tax=Pseudomaricurvus sp. TaxID=2004510 RepID=UPI003F6AEE0F